MCSNIALQVHVSMLVKLGVSAKVHSSRRRDRRDAVLVSGMTCRPHPRFTSGRTNSVRSRTRQSNHACFLNLLCCLTWCIVRIIFNLLQDELGWVRYRLAVEEKKHIPAS